MVEVELGIEVDVEVDAVDVDLSVEEEVLVGIVEIGTVLVNIGEFSSL